MVSELEILTVLRHDMHKIQILGAPAHKDALPDKIARRADAFASWISRNLLHESFEKSHYRKSLIYQPHNNQNPRVLINQHRLEAQQLFRESNPTKLHDAILRSQLLHLYSEARTYPYTSLKYHILLTCALYYNFKNGSKLNELYLCENLPPESPFQLIYRDIDRYWAILPAQKEQGLSKILAQFSKTWERRRKISFGGEHQIFAELLTIIGSWTVALAAMEDFFEFIGI